MPRHKFTAEEQKRGDQFKTGLKAVESGRKGGIKSGESKRRTKSMAELASLIANAPISSAKTKGQLKNMGIDAPDDLTNQAAIVAAVYMSAVSGDMKAVEKWQELTEAIARPKDTVEDDALSKSLKELGEGLESDD